MSKRRRYIGPAVLSIVAGLLALGAVLSTHGLKPVNAPLDLKSGARSTVEFRAKHSGSYYVGVEMNRQQAQRLFPCMADSASSSYGRCAPGEFPLELLLHMQAAEGVAPLNLRTDRSLTGGSSHGNAFTRAIAYTWLEGGKTYRLTATSQVDGTSLGPTTPRLVVEMEAISGKEKGPVAMLLALLACIAGVAAIVWAAVIVRFSGPSPTTRT